MKVLRRQRVEREVPRLEVAVAVEKPPVRRGWDARALRAEIASEFRGYGVVVREESFK